MGFIIIGNGVIVSVKMFVLEHIDEIKEFKNTYDDDDDRIEILNKIVKLHIGDYEISAIGHDSFNSDATKLFESTNNADSFEIIKRLNEEVKLNKETVPFDDIYGSDLMFLGCFKQLDTLDKIDIRMQSSTLINALTIMVPQIVKYSYELATTDVTKLGNIFKQTPCIWTFSNDCFC